jgi:hypothetical protein
MRLRLDKRGRPFIICRICGTRAFIHGEGWKGPQLLFGKLQVALDAGLVDGARELVRRAVETEP